MASRQADRLTVLAVGAHPDDIEIGAGATLAAHAAEGHRTVMLVLTHGQMGAQGGEGIRIDEQRRAAAVLGAELRMGPFADAAMGPMKALIASIEEVVDECRPDVVMTHFPQDAHQDHRATAKATVSAARNVATILRFPGPTTLEFTPTIYVEVQDFLEQKMQALACHASQVRGSDRVDLDAIRATARYRGSQVGVQQAEVFMPLRALVTTGPGSRPYAWARSDPESD